MERPLLTPKKQERMAMFANIARRFKELNMEGSQVSAVVVELMTEFGVCRGTVYKVIRMNRLHKRRINRCDVLRYHEQLINSGMTSWEAKESTAKEFKCSTGYVYQLVKLASV